MNEGLEQNFIVWVNSLQLYTYPYYISIKQRKKKKKKASMHITALHKKYAAYLKMYIEHNITHMRCEKTVSVITSIRLACRS